MPDETKLPKWAQQELVRLRRERDDYLHQLNSTNVQMKDEDTGAWYWADGCKRKCPSAEWVGYTKHGIELDVVSREDGSIDITYGAVNGCNEVAVCPRAANVFRLRCIPRKAIFNAN